MYSTICFSLHVKQHQTFFWTWNCNFSHIHIDNKVHFKLLLSVQFNICNLNVWSAQQHSVLHLMSEPCVGDFRSSSVSQHVVLHALHTGVLSHFRTIGWLIVLHLWNHRHKPWVIHGMHIITWVPSADNMCGLCLRHYVLWFATLSGKYVRII